MSLNTVDDFKIPHLEKQSKRNKGEELTSLDCDPEIILKGNEPLVRLEEQKPVEMGVESAS